MLIVGAGTGTDVAVALRKGVDHVDAVEIDPTLLRFGRQHSPDRAYQDPRVSAHVNDGRAFLRTDEDQYDLILFALPDSLTLVSGASSLRLESYLFTEQAVQSARAHLAPGGAFAMYNYYRRALARSTGSPARSTRSSAIRRASSPTHQSYFRRSHGRPDAGRPTMRGDVGTSGRRSGPGVRRQAVLVPQRQHDPLAVHGRRSGSSCSPASSRCSGCCSATPRSARNWRRVGGDLRGMWSYRDLFLLGAAFLLLETRSVTGFALLFGTTWVVNSLVFAGILLAVLGAVEITRRGWAPPLTVAYGLLLGRWR